MPDAKRLQRGVLGVLLELFFWAVLAVSFLWTYIHVYGAPTQSMGPHIGVLGNVVMAQWALRAAVGHYLRGGVLGRAISVAVFITCASIVVVYYALVLAGLQSWGRVITWRLIVTYAVQMGDLAQSLGITTNGLVVAVMVAVLLLSGVARLLWRRLEGPAVLLSACSPRVAPVLLVVVLCIVVIRVAEIVQEIELPMGEPVRLTFFSPPAARVMQNNAVGGGEQANAAAHQALVSYEPNPTANRRNVILIVGDALRPDHLGLNGYNRDTTPFLSELAQHGNLRTVNLMRSICAESACGLLGIARARFVHQMTDSDLTLHEVLRKHGYKIRMVLGGDHTNFYGLRDAYGPIDSYFDGSMAKDRYMNDDELVLDHVGALPTWDGMPVMFQFHLMSAHGLGKRHAQDAWYEPSSNYWRQLQGQQGAPSEAATNFYDNGVRGLDRTLRALLGSLRDKGYLKNAIVVITADHGEMLGEHGEYSHAKGVYESVLRVPFVYIPQGFEPTRPILRSATASQIDIGPTILFDLDMPRPANWSGTALQMPTAREFLYFQQGTQAGLFDLRQSGRALKYWTELRSGVEFIFDVTNGQERRIDMTEVTDELRADWRRKVLPMIAGVSY